MSFRVKSSTTKPSDYKKSIDHDELVRARHENLSLNARKSKNLQLGKRRLNLEGPDVEPILDKDDLEVEFSRLKSLVSGYFTQFGVTSQDDVKNSVFDPQHVTQDSLTALQPILTSLKRLFQTHLAEISDILDTGLATIFATILESDRADADAKFLACYVFSNIACLGTPVDCEVSDGLAHPRCCLHIY